MSEQNIVRVEARIIVDYDTANMGSDAVRDLPFGLDRTIRHQIGAGLLTGHTMATVETYEVVCNPAPLWYVRAQNTDGEDLDLIVRAPNKNDAKRLWEAYYLNVSDEGDALPEVDWIGQIPETTNHGAIPWDTIHKNGE